MNTFQPKTKLTAKIEKKIVLHKMFNEISFCLYISFQKYNVKS